MDLEIIPEETVDSDAVSANPTRKRAGSPPDEQHASRRPELYVAMPPDKRRRLSSVGSAGRSARHASRTQRARGRRATKSFSPQLLPGQQAVGDILGPDAQVATHDWGERAIEWVVRARQRIEQQQGAARAPRSVNVMASGDNHAIDTPADPMQVDVDGDIPETSSSPSAKATEERT